MFESYALLSLMKVHKKPHVRDLKFSVESGIKEHLS